MTVNQLEGWMRAEQPHHIMRLMRANGWLREHAPEIDRLYGVPQRADHHPEVDTGLHIELSLEVISRLTRDPMVRYGVLVHDLGKALTPQAEWPKHHKHEELGVEPGYVLGRRLGVPDEWQAFGALVSRYHLHVHRALDVPARSVVRFFRDAELFERPHVVEGLTLACEADARGRAGRQDREYPQGAFIRKAFAITSGVTVDNPVKLHETRIRVLEQSLQTQTPVT